MKRLLAMMVVAGAAISFAPAHAETCAPAAPVGQACVKDNNAVVLQGADTNPSPFGGYITVNDSNSGTVICARGDASYNDPENDFSCDYSA